MVSRKAKVGIVVTTIIVVGIVGAAAYYSSSRQSGTIPNFPDAPSEQEIETQIAQASPNPNIDRIWTKGA